MVTEITPYPISVRVCMYKYMSVCVCVCVYADVETLKAHSGTSKNHVLCHKREGQREEKSVVHTRRHVLLYRLQTNLCNKFYLLTAIVCVIKFHKTQTHFISLSTKRAQGSICP